MGLQCSVQLGPKDLVPLDEVRPAWSTDVSNWRSLRIPEQGSKG